MKRIFYASCESCIPTCWRTLLSWPPSGSIPINRLLLLSEAELPLWEITEPNSVAETTLAIPVMALAAATPLLRRRAVVRRSPRKSPDVPQRTPDGLYTLEVWFSETLRANSKLHYMMKAGEKLENFFESSIRTEINDQDTLFFYRDQFLKLERSITVNAESIRIFRVSILPSLLLRTKRRPR